MELCEIKELGGLKEQDVLMELAVFTGITDIANYIQFGICR